MTINPGALELPEETTARWTAEQESVEQQQRDVDTDAARHTHQWVTDDNGDAPGHVTYCADCGVEA